MRLFPGRRRMGICLGICLGVLLFPPTLFAADCREDLKEGMGHFGRTHQGESHFVKGIAAYQRAAKDPRCAYEAKWRLSELYLCRGRVNEKKEEKLAAFSLGLKMAEEAIAGNPQGPHGHYYYAVNLGSIVEVDGVAKNIFKVRKIMKANDRALALDPDFGPALVVKARIMLDMPGFFGGSDVAAEALLKKAIRSEATFGPGYLSLAKLYYQQKRYSESKDLLDTLMSDDFPHPFPAPWLTINRPQALELEKKLRAELSGPGP